MSNTRPFNTGLSVSGLSGAPRKGANRLGECEAIVDKLSPTINGSRDKVGGDASPRNTRGVYLLRFGAPHFYFAIHRLSLTRDVYKVGANFF